MPKKVVLRSTLRLSAWFHSDRTQSDPGFNLFSIQIGSLVGHPWITLASSSDGRAKEPKFEADRTNLYIPSFGGGSTSVSKVWARNHENMGSNPGHNGNLLGV